MMLIYLSAINSSYFMMSDLNDAMKEIKLIILVCRVFLSSSGPYPYQFEFIQFTKQNSTHPTIQARETDFLRVQFKLDLRYYIVKIR